MKSWETDGTVIKLDILLVDCPYCGWENYTQRTETRTHWDRTKYCSHCGQRVAKPKEEKTNANV